jgi:hypothetical protein
MRWPLLEVLVDAAPGRGDDYVRLDPTRDMRQMRTFALTAPMHKHTLVAH